MNHTHSNRPGKVKLSGAVQAWTLAVLDRFRRDAGLKTKSAALCQALDQWARDYGKDSAIEKTIAKYGKAYEQVSAREERQVRRILSLVRQAQQLP